MAEEQISNRPDVLTTLIHIGNLFHTQRDFDQLLETIVHETIKILHADRASIFLLDEEKEEVWSKIATGLNKGEVIRMNRDAGIVGHVIKTGKPLNITDAYKDNRFNPEIDRETGYVTKSIICFPLTTFEGMTVGAFQVLNKAGGDFTAEDEQILSLLSTQAFVAIENVQEYQATVEKHQSLSTENFNLKTQLKGKYAYPTIVGDSSQIEQVKVAIDKVSNTNANVLITGESGTGKELIARAIHSKSNRSNQSFIPLNCASLPESLLESELFGIEKGIATGVSKRTGYFELADKGTLFLDEVGEMSLAMQAKLLRALQEHTFIRVGGIQEIHVDVRVIAATNRELNGAIEKGEFREDLFYRLNVFPIHLPPLRERAGDLPILARFILGNVVDKMNLQPKSFSQKSFESMQGYSWPGNVRELENMIERAVIMSDGVEVEMEPILNALQKKKNIGQNAGFPSGGTNATSGTVSQDNLNLKDAVKDLEVRMIHQALEKTKNNQLKAAQVLGISREGLRKKLSRYKIS